MVAAARAAGLPCLAHDEMSPDDRAAHRALGVAISEFPMTRDTARAARAAGETVVFGAPNVVRGGSQNHAVDAAPAIAEGLGTVLASDYWYPAPLQAAFLLTERYGMPFFAAWGCVSANAAAAVGLNDRGRLDPGLRADIIAVCPKSRSVKAVWVGGARKLIRD
jgi:alpha-D-ribose 1-methylphosphonate 5-triphosphate diphosphatase